MKSFIKNFIKSGTALLLFLQIKFIVLYKYSSINFFIYFVKLKKHYSTGLHCYKIRRHPPRQTALKSKFFIKNVTIVSITSNTNEVCNFLVEIIETIYLDRKWEKTH